MPLVRYTLGSQRVGGESMTELFLTAGFFGVAMLVMAVGVIFGQKELQGSCGGAAKCLCEISGRPIPEECRENREAVAAKS